MMEKHRHLSSDRHGLVGLVTAAIVTCLVAPAAARAAMPTLAGDGWHRWGVRAVAGAPDWCCYRRSGDRVLDAGCNLDDANPGYGSQHDADADPAAMTVYAEIDDGEVVDLRTFSVSCEVTSNAPVTGHGHIDNRDSIEWLRTHVQPRGRLATQALAAIAVHDGSAARDVLVRTARSDSELANRKDAVFWVGQVLRPDTTDDLRYLLFDDPSPSLRKHAAFSVSQSKLPDRAAWLARLGRSDTSAAVRGKAWFWLAQTGEPGAGDLVRAALGTETSRRVRDEAIFALSQLDGEAGTDALIDIVETRSLPQADRKQALFWLAQSRSDRALDYLARVLD